MGVTAEKRRVELLKQLTNTANPLSGQKLGKMNNVSRQIIVQDIAILRTKGYPIVSTTRGYFIDLPKTVAKTFKVRHTNEQTEDELLTIVNLGGTIANVTVNHKIYGKLTASLNISTVQDVDFFMENIRSGKSAPLMNITSGYHFHRITAESEAILDLIENALREKNYLSEIFPYEKDSFQ